MKLCLWSLPLQKNLKVALPQRLMGRGGLGARTDLAGRGGLAARSGLAGRGGREAVVNPAGLKELLNRSFNHLAVAVLINAQAAVVLAP